MGNLSEAERDELLELRDSAALREDLRVLRRRAARAGADLDAYVRFATQVARMANHPGRPFRRMDGNQMKL